jgi:hypothetical protein
MWSLGHIFSEAVTWIVFGYQGLCARGKRLRLKDASSLGITMTKWHDHVRNNIRTSDGLMMRVLDLVDHHLLQDDPAMRPSCSILLGLTATILREASAYPVSGPNVSLTNTIGSFCEEPPAQLDMVLPEQEGRLPNSRGGCNPRSSQSVTIHRCSDTSTYESLDSDFHVKHSNFFSKGRVFSILWPELTDASNTCTRTTGSYSVVRKKTFRSSGFVKSHGDNACIETQVQRFIVIGNGKNNSDAHCASPRTTYQHSYGCQETLAKFEISIPLLSEFNSYMETRSTNRNDGQHQASAPRFRTTHGELHQPHGYSHISVHETHCTACDKALLGVRKPPAVEDGCYYVVPIMSYQRGVSRVGAHPAEHAIAYTTKSFDDSSHHSSSLATANPLEELAGRLDQYLSGRQEHFTTILIPADGEPDAATYNAMKQLLSDFWHSPCRRAFHDNLRIRFLVMSSDCESEPLRRPLELLFP